MLHHVVAHRQRETWSAYILCPGNDLVKPLLAKQCCSVMFTYAQYSTFDFVTVIRQKSLAAKKFLHNATYKLLTFLTNTKNAKRSLLRSERETLKCTIMSSTFKTWLLTKIASVSHLSFYIQDDGDFIYRGNRETMMKILVLVLLSVLIL